MKRAFVSVYLFHDGAFSFTIMSAIFKMSMCIHVISGVQELHQYLYKMKLELILLASENVFISLYVTAVCVGVRWHIRGIPCGTWNP